MPNLVETYALQTGLKIGHPMPFEHFFPLPDGKYILINPSSGMPSKNYDYYNDVVQGIKRYLPAGYQIVQIGMKEDPGLFDVVHLQGETSPNQMMFLIKNCEMLIGNDSSAVHIASSYDKPIVALYGSTSAKIHGPHWGDKSKQRLLESHRKGKKPALVKEEHPKSVNLIMPEEVIQAALDLLGIDQKITQETLFLGDKYHGTTIELVCNQVLNPKDFPNIIVNARMDYVFNEQGLFANLSTRKLCIVTDKPITLEPLKQLRQNIAMVIYILRPDYSKQFINDLRNAGIMYRTVAELDGEELSNARLDLFDLANVMARKKLTKESIEKCAKIGKNTMYRSNRFILSEGKVFLNQISLQQGVACAGQRDNAAPVIDDPKFWEDVDYMHIYNE